MWTNFCPRNASMLLLEFLSPKDLSVLVSIKVKQAVAMTCICNSSLGIYHLLDLLGHDRIKLFKINA